MRGYLNVCMRTCREKDRKRSDASASTRRRDDGHGAVGVFDPDENMIGGYSVDGAVEDRISPEEGDRKHSLRPHCADVLHNLFTDLGNGRVFVILHIGVLSRSIGK
ncbi:MAG: hypothetical protein JWO50_186 [Candidatus Kaiserbacteria bacterium]|nr:hypothetical protein [Candidatus Kaiserbacteria bacterium]